jgi:folate-dependent phosphoribosylglycinamide formyltransferase PurN
MDAAARPGDTRKMSAATEVALLLGGPGLLAALAARAFLAAGGRIGGFLHAEEESSWREDRLLARLRPELSATAAMRRAGVEPQAMPAGQTTATLLAAIERSGATLLLSAGFRRRVPAAVRARLPGRTLNLHPALLPAYRGPALSLAMLRDDAYATAGGASLHLMDEGFDTGPLIARRRIGRPLPQDALGYRLAAAAAAVALVAEALPAFLAGRLPAWPQPAEGGPEARLAPGDRIIGPEWDRLRITRLAAALPWTDHLAVPGADGRPVFVVGRPRFLPASAPPPPPGWVQVPYAEGMVRFRRRSVWDKRLWQARRLLRLLRAPIPPPGPRVPP